MADKTATFAIRIPTETNADASANSIDKLRAQIDASQGAIKRYQSSLRNLRGASDEVKTAKADLKGAINAERDAMSRATLALGRQGTTVLDLKGKIDPLTKSMGESTSAMGLMTTGAGALAAAVIAVTAGLGSAIVSLGRFVLEQGNALRTMSLMREAASGSAENALHLGHQIDALGASVPQTRKELNDLSISLTRSVAGTRVTGQGMIDTFNAVAQASAAMGDQAGSQIRGIIERGKLFGRLGLGVNELQGTGISFQDVAGQLSKDLKIGLTDAQMQLRMGLVNVNTGASAIRKVIETKFGKINARQMLDLNVMSAKFKDTLAKLTDGVNLEPVLEGFQKLMKLFDTGTIAGSALKGIITDFSSALSFAFKGSLPFIEKFFKQFIIESLRFEVAVLKAAVFVKEKFGVNVRKLFGDLQEGTIAIRVAQVAFYGIAAAVGAAAAAVGALAAGLLGVYTVFKDVYAFYTGIYDAFKNKDWAAIGSSIGVGLLEGFKSGVAKMGDWVSNVGTTIKDKFKNALGIHSPSKVFEEYGRQTSEGYARGVDAKAPTLALTQMVGPLQGSKGGVGGGGNTVNVTLNLSFPNVAKSEEIQGALTGPTFRAQLTRAIEEALIGGGVPTQVEGA